MPMGKGGVMPVGCGRETSMGEAAARAAMAATSSARRPSSSNALFELEARFGPLTVGESVFRMFAR